MKWEINFWIISLKIISLSPSTKNSYVVELGLGFRLYWSEFVSMFLWNNCGFLFTYSLLCSPRGQRHTGFQKQQAISRVLPDKHQWKDLHSRAVVPSFAFLFTIFILGSPHRGATAPSFSFMKVFHAPHPRPCALVPSNLA